MPRFRCLLLFLVLLFPLRGAEVASPARTPVKTLKITILSTMLADGDELGEWGFSALVEVDGHRLLFDTGAHPDVVLRNAQTLKIDLATVPDVILSHSHSDHTGGFMPLRRSVATQAPAALARTFVGLGIFYPRAEGKNGPMTNRMLALKSDYEATGGTFVVCEKPLRLFPGVWLTGPVPRQHPERNWPAGSRVTTPNGVVEDFIPEDMSLVFETTHGLVILTGCGHAGIVNTIEQARRIVQPARVHALLGGIHLFNATDDTLQWTADRLREFGVDHLIGAHCTGVETVYRLRTALALDRAHAVVGAVGATFELGQGIDPGDIAK